LELLRTYCDENYLTRRECRAMGLRVVYTALKRTVKQLAAGKPRNSGSLLLVCWRALWG
jgi:hypothetical protein